MLWEPVTSAILVIRDKGLGEVVTGALDHATLWCTILHYPMTCLTSEHIFQLVEVFIGTITS